MAKTANWIRVKITNRQTGRTMYLYHTPKDGAAGEDVDRELRAILGIPSPQPPGYNSTVTIQALPGPANWLTEMVPASEIPAAEE